MKKENLKKVVDKLVKKYPDLGDVALVGRMMIITFTTRTGMVDAIHMFIPETDTPLAQKTFLAELDGELFNRNAK